MVRNVKSIAVAALALMAVAAPAKAAMIDFTAYPVGTSGTLTGSVGSIDWTLTSSRGEIRAPEACTSPVPELACVNDGLGISGSEISGNSKDYIQIVFSRNVALVATWFLDLFIARDGSNAEIAYVSKGTPSGVPDVTVVADKVYPGGNGYRKAEGFRLIGTTFSFFVDPDGNDNLGRPDAALAAVEIAPVPLPAAGMLMLGALGGLAVLNRRRQRTA